MPIKPSAQGRDFQSTKIRLFKVLAPGPPVRLPLGPSVPHAEPR
jgi:hypothetical protein